VSLSVAYQQMIERALFGRQTFTAPPATIYAAAFIGGAEVSGDGYARVALANDTTTFPSADPLVNGVAISFPIVSVAKNDIDSVRFFDASSGGNEIGRSETFAQTDVPANGYLYIPAGGLTISVL
jgi:hypothetical protein